MNLPCFLLVYAGLTGIALAMPRHHRAAFKQELDTKTRLLRKLAGWSLLVASFAAACLDAGVELGIVTWFAQIAFSGMLLTLTLSRRPGLWHLPLGAGLGVWLLGFVV